MTKKLLLCACFLALAAIGFFHFPGHTILQSDTQIYLPILEHYWDSSLLARDLVAVNPHVSFTAYDEVAIGLRHLTGFGFEQLLLGQQFVYRTFAILGIFLIGTGIGLSTRMSLLVAAILSLGATMNGPAVLIVEYEPVPRGFALPFILLSLGLLAHNRWMLSCIAAGVAFLFHPPTALAYFALLFLLALYRKQFMPAGILVGAAVLMGVLAALQQNVPEHQRFFSRIAPSLEELQRMRASYNWVSIWVGRFLPHYLLLWLVSIAAFFRIRRLLQPRLALFFLGLPAIGILSVPLSYLLTEKLKWILMPQFQPGRYLLFTVMFAMLAGSIAAIHAAGQRRYLESVVFFAVAFAVPMELTLLRISMAHFLLATALACVAALAAGFDLRPNRRLLAAVLTAVAALAPFAAIPTLGHVRNFPALHSPELNSLAEWAKYSTPKDAMFQFADAGEQLDPGVFRARAQRALYVDWKSGGQVNFLRSFAETWWARWQNIKTIHPLEYYGELGIDYVVFKASHRQNGAAPVYENTKYVVYKVQRAGVSPQMAGQPRALRNLTISSGAGTRVQVSFTCIANHSPVGAEALIPAPCKRSWYIGAFTL